MVLNFDNSFQNGFMNIVKINFARNIFKEGQQKTQQLWNELSSNYHFCWTLVIAHFSKLLISWKCEKQNKFLKHYILRPSAFFSSEHVQIYFKISMKVRIDRNKKLALNKQELSITNLLHHSDKMLTRIDNWF